MKNPNQNGMTILQLILAILVVSIISIALFTRTNISTTDANSEAQRLASELRYMQLLAMTKATSQRVNFSASQYTLTQLDGSTAVTHAGLRGSNIITLTSGFTLTTNLPSSYIVFGTNGAPYQDNVGTALAATGTLTISGNGQTSSVTITQQTGMVSLPS